jgi:hypothetical protein
VLSAKQSYGAAKTPDNKAANIGILIKNSFSKSARIVPSCALIQAQLGPVGQAEKTTHTTHPDFHPGGKKHCISVDQKTEALLQP